MQASQGHHHRHATSVTQAPGTAAPTALPGGMLVAVLCSGPPYIGRSPANCLLPGRRQSEHLLSLCSPYSMAMLGGPPSSYFLSPSPSGLQHLALSYPWPFPCLDYFCFLAVLGTGTPGPWAYQTGAIRTMPLLLMMRFHCGCYHWRQCAVGIQVGCCNTHCAHGAC